MSSFTDELIIEPTEDSTKWKLVQPFRYWIQELHKGPVITVPAGFVTDFASIPQMFWSVLPPWGKYGKAAVVHDYLYQTALCPRDECDEVFLEAMEVLGVPYITRKTMYYAVRMFGQIAWDNHRKNDKKEETK